MSYIALYRKWRPTVFEDVVEQEHVVKTLRYSISTGRIAHAYLFCGTRGTGKTTMAKIFSRAINCLSPQNGDPCNECDICRGILNENILDVIEIDAASNNSVDNVREIRDEVIYAPSQAKYKVYIIDEVHMLSTGAFNALLKTLEEPPAHVVFILATTDPHKLPATILSRCQRFDFRRISIESIMSRLTQISQESGVTLRKDGAKLIAKMADGALRDAISILDQCISMGSKEIGYDDVLTVVGIVNDTFIAEVFDAIAAKDISRILELVDRLVMEGKDITRFIADLVYYYRNLLICKLTPDPYEIIEASKESIEKMIQQCKGLSDEELMHDIKELSLLESSLKWATHPRILLEVSLMKLCESNPAQYGGNVMERLAELERKISSGDITIKSSPAQKNNAPSANPGQAASPDKPAPKEVQRKGNIENIDSLSCWNDVLNELKSGGRMVLFTNLLGTKALELDSKFVGIVFSSDRRFCKMVVSKAENLETVEAVVSQKLGREIRIKCIDEEDLTSSRKETAAEESDELVDKAKNLAERLNVPLNIIDE
ncbi:MAG: DNA polymerase III subunit gamma/tau [Clostridia bacterium]|nr:DNA polymerase III subunit gamma/tau [Clostridia bacterium]